MKIRRMAQKKQDSFVAQIQKMKSFRDPRAAETWAAEVDEILRVAAAAPALGLSPAQAVLQRFGRGSGSSTA